MNSLSGGRTESRNLWIMYDFEELGFGGIHISNGSMLHPRNRVMSIIQCLQEIYIEYEYGRYQTSKELKLPTSNCN